MDTKLFLRSFWQIISISKFFSLQILCLFFVAYSAGLSAQIVGLRGCPPRDEFAGLLFYATIGVTIVIAVISLHPIVLPRVWLEEISREITRSRVDLRFPFFSTHPSYILLDLLLFIPAIVVFWNGQTETLCEFNSNYGQGVAAMIVALCYPTIRLIFWYVLGRQIYAMQVKNVWLGIIWWYILVFPLVAVFSYLYVKNYILPRTRVPIVSSETFAGGLPAHPEFYTGIVRLRGTIKQGIAKCGLFGKKDRTDFPYGTVVLDMGPGNGEIIIQVKRPSQVLDLEAEAARPGTFEAFGRLSKLPNPEKRMLCGISNLPDEPPPGGRALLEVELPR